MTAKTIMKNEPKSSNPQILSLIHCICTLLLTLTRNWGGHIMRGFFCKLADTDRAILQKVSCPEQANRSRVYVCFCVCSASTSASASVSMSVSMSVSVSASMSVSVWKPTKVYFRDATQRMKSCVLLQRGVVYCCSVLLYAVSVRIWLSTTNEMKLGFLHRIHLAPVLPHTKTHC